MCELVRVKLSGLHCILLSLPYITTRKPFSLRHTTHLPSSTSQLVLFHHLFCIHFWGGGSTSVFTSWGGGVPLPCSLLEGPLLCSLLGSPLPCSLLGGVHLCVHFWEEVPCDLSHNVLIYHYRMPQCIMGKIHIGPPPPHKELDRLTDRQTLLKTLPSRTLRMRAVTSGLFYNTCNCCVRSSILVCFSDKSSSLSSFSCSNPVKRDTA